ncbi:MAG: NlpC/P60 family protein, partial [Thiohalorhabdaceae bacterium]
CAPAPLPPPQKGMGRGEAASDSSKEGSARSHRLGKVARVAKSRVGAPYRYGEAGPTAFDCSGLVQYAYRNAGL